MCLNTEDIDPNADIQELQNYYGKMMMIERSCRENVSLCI